MLATNSIRGGGSRQTLERVKESGDIFMAWADEPWVVEGAAVRVSIVAQDDGSETARTLDGETVPEVHSNLTSGTDLSPAQRIPGNAGVSYVATVKGGAFDIPGELARDMLRAPTNVNGRTGGIFMAWSDEPWTVDGASVRVSIVGQKKREDDGSEAMHLLDGHPVAQINSDLTTGVDLTPARRLTENRRCSFEGDKKTGAFDIPGEIARDMLREPINVNGRSNADVVVPWVNGMDLTRRARDMFLIDFG